MKNLFILLFNFSFCLILLACKAGNGDDLNDQGRPNAETPVVVTPDNPPTEDPNKISANLTSIQEHVFTPICSVCHGGANPAAGQDLSTIENSIANLINVQSSNSLFKRVLPGFPEQSYLYLKITGNSQAGARMPLGQTPLSDEAINAIKTWIAQGAILPDNVITPTQVNSVKITANKTNTEKQKFNITLNFNQQINFTTLTNEQIQLSQYQGRKPERQVIRLASDNISFTVINAHSLLITLTKNLSVPNAANQQHFNLQLNNPSLSTITSISGQILDGDNDGIDGGVFSYDFSL